MVAESDAVDENQRPEHGLVPYQRAGRAVAATYRLPPGLSKVARQLVPTVVDEQDLAVLVVVRIRDRNLDVRGLSAYLACADRVYGRFTFGSLERYRRSRSRLEIAEVRRGSVLLILREALAAVMSPEGLALTGLVLKYLPDVIKAPAAAYRDYEEGRFRRAERKRLTQRVESDSALQQLDKGSLRQLISALVKAYRAEEHRLPSAQDFAIRSVEDVRIVTDQQRTGGRATPATRDTQTQSTAKRASRRKK